MKLTDYAEEEIRRAGLFDGDADYEGQIGVAVMELIQKFSEQGHSGTSAEMTLAIFDRVARYKPLTPIGESPDEWFEVGSGVWQNKRRSTTFSHDGGKTWYDIEDPKLNNGDRWIGHSRWRALKNGFRKGWSRGLLKSTKSP